MVPHSGALPPGEQASALAKLAADEHITVNPAGAPYERTADMTAELLPELFAPFCPEWVAE